MPKPITVKAYKGDAKTMLAFDIAASDKTNFAGFTIECKPGKKKPYYLLNKLQFKDPSKHAQVTDELPNSSINAPIQKFRWLHVPGQFHQKEGIFYGKYVYTITPRFFNKGKMEALDKANSVSVTIDVAPFEDDRLEVGFTRGFVQSQAFENHFGKNLVLKPKNGKLVFDTSAKAGKNARGESYTFLDEYMWSGFTAREKSFAFIDKVMKNKKMSIDVFAYDLNEPDIIAKLLQLAQEGRVRVILDNAALHHDKTGTKPEDQFEVMFNKKAKGKAAIKRGKYGRYAHHKVVIAYLNGKPVSVLTGSTNFSVTGLYVNSNHILIYNNADVAALYSKVFNQSWDDNVSKAKFIKSDCANTLFPLKGKDIPKSAVSFSPHDSAFALSNLTAIADRVKAEEKKKNKGSVLFAVMGIANGTGPVLPALQQVHANKTIFSYGISDSPGGISLYKQGSAKGILVSGKTQATQLPPPFDQEASIGSGHQIHHKFIVCGFNSSNPVVYCGSSNLALGGEENNGDNLIAIHDEDVVAAFAIEAIGLVDHFHFRNKFGDSKNKTGNTTKMTLNENGKWCYKYFDKNDNYYKDKMLFK